MMNLNEIALLRLVNQQIVTSAFNSVAGITRWMGAVQAQDFPMSKWAMGVRLPGSTDKTVESAIHCGEIIRTHVLRPTWHFVAAEDVYWMLQLSAPQIKTAARTRDKELGLSEAVFTKSNIIIEKALRDGNHLTRETLVALLAAEGFKNENNRVSHLLMRAEIEGIIGSGSLKAGKQTYALLAERVPETKAMKRDEAAESLAIRYFKSHGPATLKDFVWWSGLPVKECRYALEAVKNMLVSATIDSDIYWFQKPATLPVLEKNNVFLLPAFDEFIISYKNRAAALPFENHIKTISNNGIFRPMIVHNGHIIGIWKRIIKNDKINLDTEYFGSPDKATKSKVKEAFERYVQFLGKVS
jgi:hypothetical protein